VLPVSAALAELKHNGYWLQSTVGV